MSKLSFFDADIVATIFERSPEDPKATEIRSDLASPWFEEPSVAISSKPSNCLNLMLSTPEIASEP